MKQKPGTVEDWIHDPVLDHVRTDFALLRPEQSVDEAISEMRKRPPKGRGIYFYVVDKDRHVVGVVPTRRLLLSEPDRSISDIMVKSVVSMPATTSVLEAAELFTSHRFLAFPVVDDERKIVGVIDVDLFTTDLHHVDHETDHDNLFQLIGVHVADAMPSSPIAAFRVRFPWLTANIAGGMLAAMLTGFYQVELKASVALALFIPVVLALAESVSIQSVSLALQVLQGKEPTIRVIVKRLRSELVNGACLGIACAICVAAVALLWLGELTLVFCLLGGITGGVTFAAIIGAAIPNLLRFFHRDPQVAAGPIALAATDMATLSIYFTLARLLL